MTGSALMLTILLGCHKPPDAPTSLEELCNYLFLHVADDDEEALQAGVDNLIAWNDDHEGATADGYTIDNLDTAKLNDLQDLAGAPDDVIGVSLGYVHGHTEDEVSHAVIDTDYDVVFPDSYLWHTRTFDGDPACLWNGDCDLLQATNESSATYALGVDVDSSSRSEYRRIASDRGDVYLSRSWLTAVDVSVSWLQVDSQFSFNAIFPDGQGDSGNSTMRLQAAWASMRIVGASIPQSTALNTAVKQLEDESLALETYLDDQAQQ